MWYGNNGITIDRQLLVLRIEEMEFAFCFGSALMYQCVSLLAKASPSWREHFSCCNLRLHDAGIFTKVDPNMESSVEKQWSQLIGKVLSETKRGSLAWMSTEANHWNTEFFGKELSIELLTAIDETDEPVPHTIARVRCGSAHTVICAGTQPMYLLRDVLATIDSNWRLTVDSEARELEKILEILSTSDG